MRILFDNALQTAGVTALNEDASYPVTNLRSVFLEKRFQSTMTTDTLTVLPLVPVVIDTVAYEYTNCTVEIRLYRSSVLLQTLTGDNCYKVADVEIDEIQIDLTAPGTDKAYLGSIGFGKAFVIDPPESFWDETFDDRSTVSESDFGQVVQDYAKPLRIYNFYVPTLERTEARLLQDQYISTGRGAILWICPDTDGLPVMYGRLTEAVAVSKNKKQYTAKLTFKEAR